MDPFRQLLRLIWHNADTGTEVEQVAVPAGEKTEAPADVAPGIHVTVEPMPSPAPEAATDIDQAEVAQASTAAASIGTPETLPPPDDTA